MRFDVVFAVALISLSLAACDGELTLTSDAEVGTDSSTPLGDASPLADAGPGEPDGGGTPEPRTDGGTPEPPTDGGTPAIDSAVPPPEPPWIPPTTSAGDPTFAGIGGGAFTGACTSANPFGFTIGDWNRDGWPDVQVWAHGRESHCMWMNDGDGSFSAAPGWREETAPFFTGGWHMHLGDFDGDGDLDALGRTTEGRDGWMENTGSGSTPSAAFHTRPWGDRAMVTVADFDGDGDLEVADLGPTLIGFDGTTERTLATDSGSALVFDWNDDSFPDAVVPGGPSWTNNGDGTFASASVGGAFTGCGTNRALVFDAEMDGDLDVVCYAPSTRIWLVRNQGGAFVAEPDWDVGFRTIDSVGSSTSPSSAERRASPTSCSTATGLRSTVWTRRPCSRNRSRMPATAAGRRAPPAMSTWTDGSTS